MRKYIIVVFVGLLLAAGATVGVRAQGGSGACDRACLEGFVDKYLDAVIVHNPKLLPLARNVKFTENGVRLEVVGRRDRLPVPLVAAIAAAERATTGGTRLHLRLAVDYSARWAIRTSRILPDVDLLIRTGGERRLSDFLLWECAYAELHFTDAMWPDCGAGDLAAAVADFHARERRFGGLPEAAAG